MNNDHVIKLLAETLIVCLEWDAKDAPRQARETFEGCGSCVVTLELIESLVVRKVADDKFAQKNKVEDHFGRLLSAVARRSE